MPEPVTISLAPIQEIVLQCESLLESLLQPGQLSIRWLQSNDQISASVLNRPLADLAVRQLVVARELDKMNDRLKKVEEALGIVVEQDMPVSEQLVLISAEVGKASLDWLAEKLAVPRIVD